MASHVFPTCVQATSFLLSNLLLWQVARLFTRLLQLPERQLQALNEQLSLQPPLEAAGVRQLRRRHAHLRGLLHGLNDAFGPIVALLLGTIFLQVRGRQDYLLSTVTNDNIMAPPHPKYRDNN